MINNYNRKRTDYYKKTTTMMMSAFYHINPVTRKRQNPTTQHQLLYCMLYDSSSFLSVSMGGASSSPPVFRDATMGATAGAGVDDLFAFAACNL